MVKNGVFSCFFGPEKVTFLKKKAETVETDRPKDAQRFCTHFWQKRGYFTTLPKWCVGRVKPKSPNQKDPKKPEKSGVQKRVKNGHFPGF